MDKDYPSLMRRYLSTIIDGLLVIAIFFASTIFFSFENTISKYIGVSVVIFSILIYEPFSTTFFCTIGQKITGIRVRDYPSMRRINLFQAYVRIISKIFLGVISFITILFSKEQRAIHDFVVGSIVIYEK